jgi:hypothetical protein
VLATVGGLGVLTGASAVVVSDPSFKGGVSLVLLGTASGLAAGYALTRNTGFTESQANFIDLGTGAGALLGAGIGQLAASDDEQAVLVATNIGSVVGFAVMYLTYRSEALSASGGSSNFRLDLGPVPGTFRPGLRVRHRF